MRFVVFLLQIAHLANEQQQRNFSLLWPISGNREAQANHSHSAVCGQGVPKFWLKTQPYGLPTLPPQSRQDSLPQSHTGQKKTVGVTPTFIEPLLHARCWLNSLLLILRRNLWDCPYCCPMFIVLKKKYPKNLLKPPPPASKPQT